MTKSICNFIPSFSINYSTFDSPLCASTLSTLNNSRKIFLSQYDSPAPFKWRVSCYCCVRTVSPSHSTSLSLALSGLKLMLWGGKDEILRKYHLLKLSAHLKTTGVTFAKCLSNVCSVCLRCELIITIKFKGRIIGECFAIFASHSELQKISIEGYSITLIWAMYPTTCHPALQINRTWQCCMMQRVYSFISLFYILKCSGS